MCYVVVYLSNNESFYSYFSFELFVLRLAKVELILSILTVKTLSVPISNIRRKTKMESCLFLYRESSEVVALVSNIRQQAYTLKQVGYSSEPEV
jgi:hypothetical protein